MTKPYRSIPSKKRNLPKGVCMGNSGSGKKDTYLKMVASTTTIPLKNIRKFIIALVSSRVRSRLSSAVLLATLFLIIFSLPVHGNCMGRFVNPITDICWSCLFPITIGGMRVSTSGEDTENPRQIICRCNMTIPPYVRIGFPVSFWEPVRLVDVTRTPYCLVSLGGISMMDRGVQGRGSVENNSGNRMRHSFYHVHWYIYPLIY